MPTNDALPIDELIDEALEALDALMSYRERRGWIRQGAKEKYLYDHSRALLDLRSYSMRDIREFESAHRIIDSLIRDEERVLERIGERNPGSLNDEDHIKLSLAYRSRINAVFYNWILREVGK